MVRLPFREAIVQKDYFTAPSLSYTVSVLNHMQKYNNLDALSSLLVVFGCGASVCEASTSNFFNATGWRRVPGNGNKIAGTFDAVVSTVNRTISSTCFAPAKVICVAIQCDSRLGFNSSSIPEGSCSEFDYRLVTAPGVAAGASRWRPSRNQVIGGVSLLVLLVLLVLLFCFPQKVRVLLGCQKAPPPGTLVKRAGADGNGAAWAPASAASNPLHVVALHAPQHAPQQHAPYGAPQHHGYGGGAMVTMAAAAPVAVVMAAPVVYAQPATEATLPEGWVRETDGEDVWYVHVPTGQSSWVVPT